MQSQTSQVIKRDSQKSNAGKSASTGRVLGSIRNHRSPRIETGTDSDWMKDK